MKVEPVEASYSVGKAVAEALDVPGPGVQAKRVIELFDDESEDLVASFAATTDAETSGAGPSTHQDAVVPNTSGDFEFARQLFIELNREVMGIPGDGVQR